jgi:hypothetical protein
MLVQHMVPHIATKELSDIMSNRRLGFALLYTIVLSFIANLHTTL